jgi:hypothetical protein
MRLAGTRVQQEEDRCRHRKPRDRRDHGHCRARPVGELADRELAFHLESDGEEEERHEPVVHELVQGEMRFERADDELDLGVPELVVARAPWRVRPDDREDGEEQQQQRRAAVGRTALPPEQADDRGGGRGLGAAHPVSVVASG